MREIWDIYWLVKFVSTEAYVHDGIHIEHKDRIVLNLQDLYVQKTSKDPARVAEIISSAHREKPQYIEQYELDGSLIFRTTKMGRMLIEGKAWGLFKALAKENWLAVTAIGTIFTVVFLDLIPKLLRLFQ